MPEPADEARNIVSTLGLAPHPEGGWYRETWRSAERIGERAIGTAIYFLLEAGQASQWHQVDADEFWLWHAGAPLELRLAGANGANAQSIALGPDVLTGEQPQVLFPPAAGKRRPRTRAGRLSHALWRRDLSLLGLSSRTRKKRRSWIENVEVRR